MNKLSTNQYFKTLKITHVTMVFIQFIFILAALFLREEGYIRPVSGQFKVFRYIVPLFVLSGLYEGNVLYKRKLISAVKRSTLAKKLEIYRSGLIIRYVLWEAPSLLAIAAYVITGIYIYLGLSGVIILVFLFNRPTMNKVKRDLEL